MLDKLKNTIGKGVTALSVKSESIAESNRIRAAIASTQKSLDAAAAALGIHYYNRWVTGSINPAELNDDCQLVHRLNCEIAELTARLECIKEEEGRLLNAAAARPAGGPIFCPNCGKQLESSARFCDTCGSPVSQ